MIRIVLRKRNEIKTLSKICWKPYIIIRGRYFSTILTFNPKTVPSFDCLKGERERDNESKKFWQFQHNEE